MSDYFDRVERQIVQRVEAGATAREPGGRRALGYLATAAAVAVVIAVVGVFLLAGGSNRTAEPTAPTAHGVAFKFKPATINPHARLGPAIDRSIPILRERLATAFPGVRVSRVGDDIVVEAPHSGADVRARMLALTVPGQLAFYDWEADAITPNGKTVASQLRTQNSTALEISQGSGSVAAGQPGAGSMPLRRALRLESKLAPRGGYILLEAASPSGYGPANFTDPSAQFFVLRDNVALRATDIANPRLTTDPNTGAPVVMFGFTDKGRSKFQHVTAAVARRGDLVSGLGQTLNQHFAVALDNQLITVPYIDSTQYPDGINGENGADISGSFSARSARDLATILRYGPLPVSLTPAG